MKKREMIVFSLVALLVVAAAVYLGMSANLTQTAPTGETSATRSLVPDSELTALTEKIRKIQFLDQDDKERSMGEFAGKPSIVVFWASWCPDCQAQLPILAKLYEGYGNDVNFLFLNVVDETRETKESGQQYLTDNYSFAYYQDKGLQAADMLDVKNIPTMFIMDKEQRLVATFRSNQTEETLAAALEAVK